MPSDLLLTVLVILLGVCGFGVYLLNRKISRLGQSTDAGLTAWLKSMEVRLDTSSKTINESLAKQTEQMLASQREIYSKLQEEAKTVGQMSEIGRSIKDLQQFLASPKLRGGLGEQVLNQLLAQSLPRQSFFLQYAFRSGAKVDAAIKTSSGIIPIDSKFTFENFKKMVSAETEKERQSFKKSFLDDVKNRIDEISQKYIATDEGTVDFALMYVPSETVYYEIISSAESLIDYAYRRRVLPVSPSTFYAFLKSVMVSFESQQIAAEVKTIQQSLHAIHTETLKFGELLSTLQSHITNAYTSMNKVSNQFTSLSAKVEGTQRLEGQKRG